MYFREIAGQDSIKKRLIQSVKTGRISHSQLIYGPQGSSKLALALAYARYILCTDKGDEDSCGKCPSCIKIDKYVHPDLHFVYPTAPKEDKSEEGTNSKEDKKSKDENYLGEWRAAISENPYLSEYNWYEKIGIEKKQGMIKKKDARDILRTMALKAFESDYKILIMWLAERMNATVSNRLLKILEEPPPGTVFLLISDNPDRLLTTILSRTQIIRIPKFSDVEITQMLSKESEYSESQIRNAVKMANGNYHIALSSVKDESQSRENYEFFIAFMRACFSKDMVTVMAQNERFSATSREWQKNFLQYSIRMIRENYMVNLNNKQITYMADYEDDFSIKFSRFVNERNIEGLYKEFNLAFGDISSNGYARIIFLDLSLKVISLLQL
ncbi:MAG: DNA polymerase III subunit delta [Bacteroidales bacterium]|nr:DNA polymerase III subunit delta [Bacteroidales bacterium]MCF8390525.1 DNA polymerase III subunit delta [Bacteroidales bacterium]